MVRSSFSPDSQHVAYAAQQGDKCFVVVDGKPGPAYDGIGESSLVFSPDSQHVAYAAHQGTNSSWWWMGSPARPMTDIGRFARLQPG